MDSSSNNNQNTLLMTNVVSSSSSRSNWNNQKMMETTAQEQQHNNSNSNSITTTTATFHHDHHHQQQQIPICSAAGALIWPNNHPLHMIPPPPSSSSSSSSSSFFNEILGGIIQLDEDAEAEEEEEEEELGAMKEMMYKIAAMQPVEIDPATIRKPKRRNVRISEDPQSVAARHRRERISERIRILQRLVPGGTKMDTASMLDEAIRYVKFLKRQIRLLQSLPITNTFNHNHNINNNCIAPGSDSAYWPPTFASNMLIHGSVAAPPASSMDIPPAGMGFGTISHAHARDDPPTFLHHLRSS